MLLACCGLHSNYAGRQCRKFASVTAALNPAEYRFQWSRALAPSRASHMATVVDPDCETPRTTLSNASQAHDSYPSCARTTSELVCDSDAAPSAPYAWRKAGASGACENRFETNVCMKGDILRLYLAATIIVTTLYSTTQQSVYLSSCTGL
jgi:hypothetical protein